MVYYAHVHLLGALLKRKETKKEMNWLTIVLAAVCLNGPWQFKFEEDKPLEAAGGAAFVADDVMSVPGCWDVLPRYYLKHGTGLYRRA
jgi:hypothetical protein